MSTERTGAIQALHDVLDRLLASGLEPGAVEALFDDALDDALERAGMGAPLDDERPQTSEIVTLDDGEPDEV